MDVKSMQLQLCLDATPGHLSTSIYNYTLRTSLSTSAPPVSVCLAGHHSCAFLNK